MKKAIISLIVLSLAFSSFGLDGANQSPTKQVTGVFSEPVDQYTDVIDFTELDSSVLFLQLGSPYETEGTFTIGLGHQLTDFLYLGGNLSLANLGTDENSSSTMDSTSTANTSLTDRSREDKVTTAYDYSKNSYVDTDIIAGLNLGAMAIGIKVDFKMNESEVSDNIFPTITNSALGTAPSITIENNPSGNDNDELITKHFDADGNQYYEEGAHIDDGYVRSGQELDYGLTAGTTLNAGNLALDLEVLAKVEGTDSSASGEFITYKTYYESAFATYNGIENAQDYTKDVADITNVNNKLTTGLEASTTIPLLASFDFTAGLGYIFDMDMYQDGAITSTGTSTAYTASYDADGYVATSESVNEVTVKQERSRSGHTITLPITFTSKFNEMFVISIENNFSLGLENSEITNSFSSVNTTNTTNSNSAVADNTVITTREYVGDTTVYSTTAFRDTVSVGAKFYLTEKFRVNLGSTVTTRPIYVTTTNPEESGIATETVEELVDGVSTTTSTNSTTEVPVVTNTVNNNAWSSSVNFEAGFTYFVNENLALDLKYINGGTTENIFELSNWELLLTARY